VTPCAKGAQNGGEKVGRFCSSLSFETGEIGMKFGKKNSIVVLY